MHSKVIELFLHGVGRPMVIEAEADDVLRDVLGKYDALPGTGEYVFIGETGFGRDHPESDEDPHLPADLEATVAQLELATKLHIHTHALRSVQVRVEFNGKERVRRFSPHATIETVLIWSKQRFEVDPVAGADYVLELIPSGVIPRMDDFLGDLLQPGQCDLSFKLVKEVNPQGARK